MLIEAASHTAYLARNKWPLQPGQRSLADLGLHVLDRQAIRQAANGVENAVCFVREDDIANRREAERQGAFIITGPFMMRILPFKNEYNLPTKCWKRET